MNTSQNLLKMSIVRPDTSRETTPPMNASTTIEWSSFLHSTNRLCFSSPNGGKKLKFVGNFGHLTANISKTVNRSVIYQLELNTSSTTAF